MCKEGAFCRLLELIQSLRGNDHSGSGVEESLQRLLMDLLYEMSRIQRVKVEDLGKSRRGYRIALLPGGWDQHIAIIYLLLNLTVTVDDEFIKYLLQIIEGPPEEPNDPYHYPVIRVLVRYSVQCF